jgi:KUP system potassium uptake protein
VTPKAAGPGPADAAEGVDASDRQRPTAAQIGTGALALGALGVVFGDIGTSPLYALQAVFAMSGHPAPGNPAEVYGVISLVFWAITLIVSIKYVGFIMRADNDGEGGIMALTALLQRAAVKRTAAITTLVTLGILGASLFYGDGVITPAISVLSAVSGLKIAVHGLDSMIVPITVAVLTILFAIQHFGTGLVGRLFGPVMALWFAVLAIAGAAEILKHPAIVRALSPSYGARFFLDHGGVAFLALASVVLAVTGAEALYADMGHFGRSPIRRAWFAVAFPALTLNYLGQGSLILRSPAAVSNPFFLLFPGWSEIPMVLLATAATVIASQAVISGAFSVTQQAMQLDFLPRVTIRQTSRQLGQIYVPAVNGALFVAVVAIVIGFGSATALASAYGVAVTGTFVLNTILFLAVARLLWHTSWRLIALGAIVFLSVELTLFAANLTKIVHGGWLPLGIALIVFTILTTWRKGQRTVTRNRVSREGSMSDFIAGVDARDDHVVRVPGLAVFLNAHAATTPLALRANLDYNHVLHEDIVIITIKTERVPHVSDADRLAVTGVCRPGDNITVLTARFGFQDRPNIPATLRLALEQKLLEREVDVDEAYYFLSHITIVPTRKGGMTRWRKRLFLAMAHNAANAADYFGLPDNRTLTIGERIEF